MQDHRLYKTQALNALLQVTFHVLSFVILYTAYAFFNVGLQNLSRTAITTTISYFISVALFTSVYGPFRVGPMRKRQLFANSACTVLFCDFITFIQLQVMNTNPQNAEANARFVLFDQNLPLTFAAFFLQAVLIFCLINAGYRVYRGINPPKKCLLVCATQESAEHAARKITGYPFDFSLSEVVSYTCPDLEDTILEHEIVFLTDVPAENAREIIRFCYEKDRVLYQQAELEQVVCNAAAENVLVDSAFLTMGRRKPSIVSLGMKRAFDIVCSVILLVVLSPVLLITALLLALSGNGSVIFRQERKTVNGRVFNIMKFRTMYKDTAADQSMRKGDDRITPLGHFLRKYRIDELPQLINILRGDMSLVGPRPEMLSNVEKYTAEVPEFLYREQMKAGITGLAQLDGRYDTSPKDKAILDLIYIERFSIGLDIKLILRTFTVFFRHDKEGFTEEKQVAPLMRTQPRQG